MLLAKRVVDPRWVGSGALVVLALLTVGVLLDVSALASVDHAVAVPLFEIAAGHAALARAALAVQTAFSLLPMTAYAVLVAAALLARRHLRAAAAVALTMLSSTILDDLVKLAVDRPRPTWPDPLATLRSPSFPSGHSCAVAAAGTLLVIVAGHLGGARARRPATVVAVAIGLVVGLDRLLLGVHYLSDVIGGYALGVATALVCTALVRDRGPAEVARTT